MATVKELYHLIKEKQRNGEKIGILQQSIVNSYEAKVPQTTKQVIATFIKNKKGDEYGNN
ncbi:hypothetical protein [Candidatus Pelagibacter sp.]|uniref:hypothetical protein n=1 Tax=Candidatus Pelagibacter sp. TaxID=2024849 RepID=UPI003F825DE0